jgi:hypothetical protein
MRDSNALGRLLLYCQTIPVDKGTPIPKTCGVSSAARDPVFFTDSDHIRLRTHPLSLFIRNTVMYKGDTFPVVAIPPRGFETGRFGQVCIAANVETIGNQCFGSCELDSFALEYDPHVRRIGASCFAFVKYLQLFPIAPFGPDDTRTDYSVQIRTPTEPIESLPEAPEASVPTFPIDFRDSDMVDLKTFRFLIRDQMEGLTISRPFLRFGRRVF